MAVRHFLHNVLVCGIKLFLLPLVLTIPAHTGTNDPFPPGVSMGNSGTIMQANGVSGRQPWVPACFLNDSVFCGIAASAVTYYDDMDNLSSSRIRQAFAGGFVNHNLCTVKAGWSFLNAFHLYGEHSGYCSAGTRLCDFVFISYEVQGFYTGLLYDDDERRTVLLSGQSVWIPFRFVSFSFSRRNVPLVSGHHAIPVAPPTTYCFGLHSNTHRYGAQGLRVVVTPAYENMIRVAIGEELRLGGYLDISVGFQTDPMLFCCGACLSLPPVDAWMGFVHHRLLGWSKGAGCAWSR